MTLDNIKTFASNNFWFHRLHVLQLNYLSAARILSWGEQGKKTNMKTNRYTVYVQYTHNNLFNEIS